MLGACLTDAQVLSLVRGGQGAGAMREHVDQCADCQELLALAASPEPERLLGRFEIVRELGRGAMGIVYLVFDPKLKRQLAIKVLQACDEKAERRLEREAQTLARLAHPNIVTVFDVDVFEDRVYMTMEHVRGVSLRTWLGMAPRRRAEVLGVFLQAGEGLHVAHRAGVIHRDFKPENVLVGDEGRVRIVDFGLAQAGLLPDENRHGLGTATLLTLSRTGAIVGTPAYMAPEQHRGESADARSDQFAFAVSLWEALWGTRPFAGATPAEVLQSIERAAFHVPSSARRDALLPVLRRALAYKSDDRFPSMLALLKALREPKPRRAQMVAMGAVALAAVPLGYALWPSSRTFARETLVTMRPPASENTAITPNVVLQNTPIAAPSRADEPASPAARPTMTRPLSMRSAKPRPALDRVEEPAALPAEPRVLRGPNGAPLIP